MMTEKELIAKIRELRQTKPTKDWVFLTKSQILGEEERVSSVGYYLRWFFSPARTVFVSLTTFVLILFGIFGLSQISLPGDLLYPVKKIMERSQAVFVSETDKPQASLELANKRLEELTKIAETNQVKKLASALEEYQASVTQAAKNLAKATATTSDPAVIRELAERTQELEKNEEKLKQTYGIAVPEIKEVSNSEKVIVEWIFNDLEKRTLTEGQEETLKQMRELTGEEKYSEALKLYLTNQ